MVAPISHRVCRRGYRAQQNRPCKHEIAKLIDILKGDRIGRIVFAGESYVQCPLTLDYGAAKMFLSAVSTGWGDSGTAQDAIKQASEASAPKHASTK